MQDDRGGLQIRDEDESWIHAAPIQDSLVVNLGDLTARWTNDRFRSTRHRVVNASRRERCSVPFFYDGNPAEPIECLPGCLSPGEAAHYPPTTPAEHLQEKFRDTLAL